MNKSSIDELFKELFGYYPKMSSNQEKVNQS
jgi:hypothetical protein